jgi:putative endonuclease
MPAGWVYILTNRPNGTLYVGVTSNVRLRLEQHRAGTTGSFTSKYGLYRLVYAERYDDITQAIQREKNIKHWPRAWKTRLIGRNNPAWEDLTKTLPY